MMHSSENPCPVCHYKNEVEAVLCGNCGAALPDPFLDPGARTKTSDMPAVRPEMLHEWPREWSVDHVTAPHTGIAVYVEGESTPVYVDATGEIVLGRKVGTTSEDLLDLAPRGGYHLGLSRRHAVIRRTAQGYELLDLGSVNGTWLNEEKLVPHKPYPLSSGSHLRLGRMRLFVLYRPVTESDN